MAKAEKLRTQVKELFEKTRVTFDIHEKTLIELKMDFTAEFAGLRQGVQAWSVKHAEEAKHMVQTDNFNTRFENKPTTGQTKHDKKELSVW